MSATKYGSNSAERRMYKELEEEIERNTPRLVDLEKALDALSEKVELSSDERNSLLRDLERIWHLMRLMKLLSEYFGDWICFGGGAVLNYIYMVGAGEKPRFTFDLDSSWRKPASAKREILWYIPLFNKWLAEKGYSFRVPIRADRYTRLWVVEYDAEKDFFPGVLSLRVPVLTRYAGEPFYRFLGISDYGTIMRLREIFQRVLGVRDPLVDYVRFEISLELREAPVVEVSRVDIFGGRLEALVTEPELQLAWKILWRLGKRYENPETALHDVLKATLDLRLLKHLDADRVRDYVARAEKPEVILGNAEANLATLREHGVALWSKHHYVLVRKTRTLEEIVDEVRNMLRNTVFSALHDCPWVAD